MSDFAIQFWLFVFTAGALALTIWFFRKLFKKLKPVVEHLRDTGHEFYLYIVLCLMLLGGAIQAAQFIKGHEEYIIQFFTWVRELRKPDEPMTIEEMTIEEMTRQLEAIKK